MKRLIIIASSIFVFTLSMQSQTINNIPLNQLESEFVTVTHKESATFLLGRVVMEFGNGMYVTNIRRKRDDEAELRGANGELLEVHSAIHAVNLFVDNGYELIEFKSTPFGDAGLVTTYLLGKKALTTK